MTNVAAPNEGDLAAQIHELQPDPSQPSQPEHDHQQRADLGQIERAQYGQIGQRCRVAVAGDVRIDDPAPQKDRARCGPIDQVCAQMRAYRPGDPLPALREEQEQCGGHQCPGDQRPYRLARHELVDAPRDLPGADRGEQPDETGVQVVEPIGPEARAPASASLIDAFMPVQKPEVDAERERPGEPAEARRRDALCRRRRRRPVRSPPSTAGVRAPESVQGARRCAARAG